MANASGIDKTLIGPAGEHLVLARLLSQGFLASPAPRGTRKVDIIVNYIDGGNPKLVQVKTTMNQFRYGWVLSEKHEVIDDPDLFYCFVNFNGSLGEVYVVPAAEVAKAISDSHRTWLAGEGKDGSARKDSPVRNFGIKMFGKSEDWLDEYKENWSQLL
jgi:hypothetical protein